MSIPERDYTGQITGYAAREINLANADPEPEMGGRDPRAPLTFTTVAVRGMLLIGHTYDLADENARIYLEEQPPPGRVRDPDFRCTECVTKSSIAYQHGCTWVVMEHTRSCRWLREMVRRHPR